MHTTVHVSLTGDIPGDVQIGDVLNINGQVTVHAIEAELVDVSTIGQASYVIAQVSVTGQANEISFERA